MHFHSARTRVDPKLPPRYMQARARPCSQFGLFVLSPSHCCVQGDIAFIMSHLLADGASLPQRRCHAGVRSRQDVRQERMLHTRSIFRVPRCSSTGIRSRTNEHAALSLQAYRNRNRMMREWAANQTRDAYSTWTRCRERPASPRRAVKIINTIVATCAAQAPISAASTTLGTRTTRFVLLTHSTLCL